MKPITSGLPPPLNLPDSHTGVPDTESSTTALQPDHLSVDDETAPCKYDHVAAQSVSATGKTREQVRAELAAAKAAGVVTYGEQEYPVVPPASGPSKTREQVRAELAQAKAAGLVTYGEQEYPVTPPSSDSGKTREQVRAELAEAKAAGLVTYGEQEYPPTPTPLATDQALEPSRRSPIDRLCSAIKQLWSHTK